MCLLLCIYLITFLLISVIRYTVLISLVIFIVVMFMFMFALMHTFKRLCLSMHPSVYIVQNARGQSQRGRARVAQPHNLG